MTRYELEAELELIKKTIEWVLKTDVNNSPRLFKLMYLHTTILNSLVTELRRELDARIDQSRSIAKNLNQDTERRLNDKIKKAA